MEDLTYRLFMVGTVGMLAATVYLLMASREVDAKYRRGVYISALVTGIAYYHYNKMTASYALNPGEFDTGLRYVDWGINCSVNVCRNYCNYFSGGSCNKEI